MKVVIAGPRKGTTLADVEMAVERALAEWKHDQEITEVVSGACEGTDLHGEEWAKARGIPVKRFYPDWSKHGKAAGPIRNKQMAEYALRVIAVWDGESTGTKSMIREAWKADRRMFVHLYKEHRV